MIGCGALSFLLLSCRLLAAPQTHVQIASLQCDGLDHPLGDDNRTPLFSWKIQDSRIGARQTAYRILVASDERKLLDGKPDVWDSGRLNSDKSIDVPYAGPALRSETRYYWRVQVWDQKSTPYPFSSVSWWETGLMGHDHWTGTWIGYEDHEQRSLREAKAQWITNPERTGFEKKKNTRHDFRLKFAVPAKIKHASIYVTGSDTVSAWLDGKQVLEAGVQPPWGRPPWRTYVRKDLMEQLHPGTNLLAVEVVRFEPGDNGRTPMNVALYAEMEDGSTRVWSSSLPEWKAQLEAEGEWVLPSYDDAAWPQAILYRPDRDPFGAEDVIGNPLPTAAVAALRHGFRIGKPVLSARLYATALGSYKFRLNGKAVGEEQLAPGWTDFRQRVFYQTYDVTPLLNEGENALAAYLAPGWYSTPLEWIGQGNNYGATPAALRGQLKITYKDGTTETIATDSSWKADLSPIAFAEIYDGETYDARRVQQGWDRAGFSESSWHPVAVVQPQEPEILWQSFQPIRATKTIEPKAVTNPKPGIWIYDFGQNLAGVARIRLHQMPGVTLQLRYAELLNPDGTLYTANLRNAKATDRYTFASSAVEEYQPSFTFHGFRYVELSGIAGAPARDAVQAVVLHTDAPFSAELKTGSPMVNQLWSNILWGQRSNFVGVPTDCPQRDERLGWSADAQVFWRTASFNMDATAFSRKYAADLRGTEVDTGMYGIYAPGTGKQSPAYGPGWSDAGVIVPWTSWIQNGDAKIVEENWSAMERYISTIFAANPDYLWKNKRGINFGDWLSPEGPTAEELIATAYWAYDVELMRQMAHGLGKKQEEEKYKELFEKIRAAFVGSWVHPEGLVGSTVEAKNDGGMHEAIRETQTGYVLALAFHLLPEEARAKAADRLVGLIARNGGKLGTGFLGTPYLLEVLSDTGHSDVAYKLLLNTDYPSWGYMVTHGATTMWERWNGDKMLGDPGMNSFNHYAYGAVAEWLYRYAAGVDATASDPGFHTVILHPNFNASLGSVDLSYESRYGRIHSQWTVKDDNGFWNVSIPANTTGQVVISSADRRSYTIGGKPLREASLGKAGSPISGACTYRLPAGSYQIAIRREAVASADCSVK